jgi:hypothetical protein
MGSVVDRTSDELAEYDGSTEPLSVLGRRQHQRTSQYFAQQIATTFDSCSRQPLTPLRDVLLNLCFDCVAVQMNLFKRLRTRDGFQQTLSLLLMPL